MEINRTEPKYLLPEDLDTLARQNAQLMAELWILKDRMTVMESLLEDAGALDRGKLDDLVPEGDLAAELERERIGFIERIMGITPEDRTVDALKARASSR